MSGRKISDWPSLVAIVKGEISNIAKPKLLYILTSCAPQTLVEIFIFCIFFAYRLKKSNKFVAKFFKFASKHLLKVKSWKKTLDQHFGANYKSFFAKFCTKFDTFWHFILFLREAEKHWKWRFLPAFWVSST